MSDIEREHDGYTTPPAHSAQVARARASGPIIAIPHLNQSAYEHHYDRRSQSHA